MEKTLKELQEYQLEALHKGISYDINIYINGQQVPDITVRMSYSVTDPVIDTRTFCATFSNEVDNKIDQMKMGRIRKFINDVDKNNK